MVSQKQFTVVSGSTTNEQINLVELNGVSEDERLTPKMARRAARVACGHNNGVTVWSNEDYGYRLYPRSARKLRAED